MVRANAKDSKDNSRLSSSSTRSSAEGTRDNGRGTSFVSSPRTAVGGRTLADARQAISIPFKKRIPIRVTARMSTTPRLTHAERLSKHYTVCRAGQLEKGRQVWRPCSLCKDHLARRGHIKNIKPSPALLARFADRLSDRKAQGSQRRSSRKSENARKSPGSSRA